MTKGKNNEIRIPNGQRHSPSSINRRGDGSSFAVWAFFRHLKFVILSSFGFRHSSFFNHTVVCDRVWR
jgi:hypothetical protein